MKEDQLRFFEEDKRGLHWELLSRSPQGLPFRDLALKLEGAGDAVLGDQKLAATGSRPESLQDLEEIFNWTSEAKFEMPCQRRDSCAHLSASDSA
ncbi:hypothetical protein E2C01_025312 [Portunus trituberculatus]|uniref:Uncharacterized protein n=1 Tax=Portunus trituberculatus TaxID=210409 RepID=A0A5B7ECM3_PORTR|nr:hypothetical protein [Portunus trituberculatus]